ncbi:DExH-box ATP-dependent RNA helicase DExH3 [Linum grandiflorum]
MPSCSVILHGCLKHTAVFASLRPTSAARVASLKPSLSSMALTSFHSSYSSSFVYVPPRFRDVSGRGFCSITKFPSSLHNFGGHDKEDWKGRLTMLIDNEGEQEVVFRDRRDFQQISAMSRQMGLYSHKYSEEVIVISKSPLPNYRPDLDDTRPIREVMLPFGLHSEVSDHLRLHLCRKPRTSKGGSSSSSLRSSMDSEETLYDEREQVVPSNATKERAFRGRSLQMRSLQQEWKESPEGQKMVQFRESLPAYKERDAFLKSLAENQVTVVSGETGCGKTTQLPQYILESEIDAARGAVCNIICTQPRRIAAMSVAERVAAERGEKIGESVGYKVRFDGVKGKDTRLLFCTTGVLLRKLVSDRNLRGVTHVIVDEIHERGMNEDFLLIVLKDLLPRRPELRLVLMSATLNAELFSSYFGGAPTLHIPGFTYPVRELFLEDILEMLGKKKSQIASAVEDTLESTDFQGYSSRTQKFLSNRNRDRTVVDLIEQVLCYIVQNERPGAVLVFMTGWNDIHFLKNMFGSNPVLGDRSKVLLLACHSSMDSSQQRLIFDKPEDGVRKIVLATNVAETSITINDVVFVVDCGKAKEKSYDALNNTPYLLPSWISKASARQRKGRAGRVQPGECYHLYRRSVYDTFADYQLPELLRKPLQSLCLQIKSLQLGSISEFLSQALEPPEALSVRNAVENLKAIGALDEKENLTLLGKQLSVLPVEPKLGKMLILGTIFKCLDPIMTVVAGLNVKDPFLMPFDKDDKDFAKTTKAQFAANSYSDHLTIVRAYDGWKNAERQQSGYEYCRKNLLSAQTLKAIDSFRKDFDTLLREAGLIDQDIANYNTWSEDWNLVRAVICAGLSPGICSVVNKGLKTMEDGPVLLYRSSVNRLATEIPYPWLAFNEKLMLDSLFLQDSTAVSDSVLLLFGGRVSSGELGGHLKMLGGNLEFLMKPELADTYLTLKSELEELIQKKLLDPKLDMESSYSDLLNATRTLLSKDNCQGRFVFSRLPTQFDARQNDQNMELLSTDAQEVFTSYEEVYKSFDAMGLHENLLRGIYAYGFEKPSAIQKSGIVPFCKGLDVIQLAPSGTGKTTNFCAGILQQLDCGIDECQALVLAPTGQLALQIQKHMKALGCYLSPKVHGCVCGTSVLEDHRIVQGGVHVVVGTPDRVFDLLREKSLRPDNIKMFVLYEADKMLSHSFQHQIHDIFQMLPAEVQIGVFSATMPPEALEITRKFMKDPVRILFKQDELTLEHIKQAYVKDVNSSSRMSSKTFLLSMLRGHEKFWEKRKFKEFYEKKL